MRKNTKAEAETDAKAEAEAETDAKVEAQTYAKAEVEAEVWNWGSLPPATQKSSETWDTVRV